MPWRDAFAIALSSAQQFLMQCFVVSWVSLVTSRIWCQTSSHFLLPRGASTKPVEITCPFFTIMQPLLPRSQVPFSPTTRQISIKYSSSAMSFGLRWPWSLILQFWYIIVFCVIKDQNSDLFFVLTLRAYSYLPFCWFPYWLQYILVHFDWLWALFLPFHLLQGWLLLGLC